MKGGGRRGKVHVTGREGEMRGEERWEERRRAAYVSQRTIRGVHDMSPGVSTRCVPPNRS